MFIKQLKPSALGTIRRNLKLQAHRLDSLLLCRQVGLVVLHAWGWRVLYLQTLNALNPKPYTPKP